MRAIEILAGLVILSCLSFIENGCKKVRSPEDLNGYVLDPDNGLHKKQTIGPVEVNLTYRPTEILVDQSKRNDSSAGEIDSLWKGFNGFDYFVLTISANGKEVETYALQNTLFGQRIQLMAFGLSDYVRIITDQKDTIPLANYTYQRTYGVGKTTDFLMAFDREKIRKSDHFRFQISDFGLDIGDQNIRFETKDIARIPQITK